MTGSRLRTLVDSGEMLVVPGAPNAVTARLIEEIGFEAVYLTGAGIANTFLGAPDVGLLSLPDVVAHLSAVRQAVELPIIVDADTGYGNPVNVWYTVRSLELAGADAVQLEDQTFPKRCGHFAGTEVIPTEDMVQKVRAAVDARRHEDLLVIARTDARAGQSIEAACERANRYREAGADLVFVEGPRNEAEIVTVATTVNGPKVLNLVDGGVTPHLPHERLKELGFSIVLHANLALLACIRAMRDVLSHLRSGDSLDARPVIGTWDERQQLVRRAMFQELEERYAVTDGR